MGRGKNHQHSKVLLQQHKVIQNKMIQQRKIEIQKKNVIEKDKNNEKTISGHS